MPHIRGSLPDREQVVLHNMRILIAEDEPISEHVLKTTLSNWGHEVVSTANGLEAWRILQSKDAPRLAILDWMMPGMEGPEICRKLRESANVTPAYIIVLTARTGVEQLVTGMQAGADDYLTKPYHRDELQVRIQVGIRMLDLQAKLASRVRELEEALNQVEVLQGIIPICGYCKNIRDDSDYWQNLETYIAVHSKVEFSHSVCPSCYDSVVRPQLDQLTESLRREVKVER
jgi:phosphoserine phosphatase RsbU/P